jgi:hypothetical protein
MRLLRQQSLLLPACEKGLQDGESPVGDTILGAKEGVTSLMTYAEPGLCIPLPALASIPLARLRCMLDEVRVLTASAKAPQPSQVRPSANLTNPIIIAAVRQGTENHS